MSKKIFDYAKKLTTNKNPLSIYIELERIMYSAGLFQEQIGLIKNIWHITNNNELLLKAGNICATVYNNFDMAYELCNLYFQKTNPSFYEMYMSILNRKGYNEFTPKFDITNYSATVFKVIDKYSAIIYIIVYLNKQKKFNEILELIPYLSVIDNQLQECMLRLSNNEKGVYNIVVTCNNHLSELLSRNEHHSDINKFAIKLNPENKQAYLNVIENYIAQDKKELAIEFYNDEYCTQFKSATSNSVVSLYWNLSDIYADIENYYKSVLCQQSAINIELGIRG